MIILKRTNFHGFVCGTWWWPGVPTLRYPEWADAVLAGLKGLTGGLGDVRYLWLTLVQYCLINCRLTDPAERGRRRLDMGGQRSRSAQ